MTPQATIFDFATPATVDARRHQRRSSSASSSRADYNGSITGVRFYKAAANTGTHIGSLWSADRHAARAGDVHRTRRPPAGRRVDVREPGRRHGRHDLRRVLLRARAATTRRRSGGLVAAVDNAPLHALANAHERRTASTPTAPTSTFPTSTYNATNYWVDVLYALPAPGQVDRRDRRRAAGATSANVTWTAPASGGPVDLLPDHAVRRLDRADAEDDHRLAAGDERDGHRPDHRARPTRSRVAGGQRQRRRARRRPPSNAVTPAARRSRRRRRPDVARAAGDEVRARDLDAAGQRRRQPDHRLDRDAVRRRRPRRRRSRSAPSATSTTVTGLDQRHGLHVPGHGDERGRHRARRRPPSNAVTPQATIFDFATPATADSGDTNAVELGVKFRADFDGLGHRHPLLQGGGQHRHAHRQPVDRAAARGSPRRRSPSETASGWQHVHVRQPGRDHGRTRPTSRRTSRRTATTRSPAAASRPPSTTRRCTRSPTATSAERRLRLRRREHASRPSSLQRRATTGSTCCSRRRRRPGAPTGVTATAGPGVGDGLLDRAVERRPGRRRTRSRRTSARPRRRRRRSPARRRPRARRSTGLTAGHGVHVHACAPSNPSGSGPESAPSERR